MRVVFPFFLNARFEFFGVGQAKGLYVEVMSMNAYGVFMIATFGYAVIFA